MILIPQLYIRGKKVVALERTISPIYDEDPFIMARYIKDAGGEALYIIDLGIQNIGAGENGAVIRKISDDLGLAVFIGGAFKSVRAVESYLNMGLKAAVLETVAYQQPSLVKEACEHFPEKIGVQIHVNAGRVTIPGWTVAANKTALDYAEQFGELGVKLFFYSDVGSDGLLGKENLQNILAFCKKVKQSVICSSEIRESADIGKLVTLGAPHLDGIILARALYEGRVDFKAAVGLMADLSLAPGNEPTILEE
jgi:phosphoribosylformimino-5-aminoimidazole carboxamide ribotide isomerase